MKYAILYDSQGGNTKLLAETINKALMKEECIYFGNGEDFNPNDCNLVFLGSWCDKGTISDALKPYVYKLANKQIGLFGSCGFGGSQQYFDNVAKRMISELPTSCIIVNTFICQGKMPISIRKRYEEMLDDAKRKAQAEAFITNFDKAFLHPDSIDIHNITEFALKCFNEVYDDDKQGY